ncbi:MAG: Na+:solute symporter [Melioribacteraceae bacterium]|nr:Na+:solute symporter [Melioribacteraceae bacterium]
MGELHWLDIIVIIAFFLIIFGIAAYYSKQAGKDTGEFFLSGRNMPWYIAGTAMVATTFAADTPLAVTELIAQNGIAGNWLWWNLAIGGMLTVFFFAKLWRRANILTDVEFVELRYSGKSAALLRGFRAIYLGLFMNAIVMGWVNKAMEKIFSVVLPTYDPFTLVIITALIIAVYSSASGLLGTSRTDSFQFVFAMIGCIVLAIIVVQRPEIGSLEVLKSKLPSSTLEFFPSIGQFGLDHAVNGVFALSVGAFIAHVGLQWWSSWYPGADPGGGGYVAQRMMSAKDEKNSVLATLWFTIAHYAVRPWPWIIVALAALVLLPRSTVEELKIENSEYFAISEQIHSKQDLSQENLILSNKEQFKIYYDKYENTVDPGLMYPKLMLMYLPAGLLGMLIAVFLAAYMSTIASQLNWGTSYLINDFYRRFIKKEEDEKHYIIVSRIGIFAVTIFSLIVTRYFLTTISGAWEFIINASAGMGAVLILRWYWWRINAWSEISAMIAPLIIYPIAKYGFGLESPITLYPIVFGTTIIWLITTYITKPVEENKLIEFYKRTYPGGAGWKRISKKVGSLKSEMNFGKALINWVLGVILVYSFLFGLGSLLFGYHTNLLIYSLLFIFSSIVIYKNLNSN